jgi:hypothetical protein
LGGRLQSLALHGLHAPHLPYCTSVPPIFWHSVLAAKKAVPVLKDW